MADGVSRRDFVRQGTFVATGLAAGMSRPMSARAEATSPALPRLHMPDGAPQAPVDLASPEFATAMKIAGVPGVARAVVPRSGDARVAVAGLIDAGRDVRVTSSTAFEAASLSKPTVAYLTLLLRDRGQLDIDRPIADVLGASPVPDDARGMRITPRHVLSHSSGLQNWRFRAGDTLTLAFDPGTAFQYSGEGYVLLSRVLERVTGAPFTQLMREVLFEPLGMTESSFLFNERYDGRMARPHSNRGTPQDSFGVRLGRALAAHAASLTPPRAAESFTYAEVEAAAAVTSPNTPAFPNFLLPNAAASLITTIGDYGRFLGVLLDASRAPASMRLRTETRDLMYTPQVSLAPRLSWGLGVGLEEGPRGRRLWHWGDNGGTKNFVLGDLADGTGQVIFTNGSGGLKLADRMLRPSYGELASTLWV